jgi:hypothetical protein
VDTAADAHPDVVATIARVSQNDHTNPLLHHHRRISCCSVLVDVFVMNVHNLYTFDFPSVICAPIAQ